MTPIYNEYGVGKTILKFFPYKGAACIVSDSGVEADSNGKKIVKAGTPYPSDDESALGVLLEDVDVTQGSAPGTYVYEGVIDGDKIAASGVSISNNALKAMPNVQVFGSAYGVGSI